MSDREEHQQPAVDSRPKKAAKKKAASSKKKVDPSDASPPVERQRPKAKLDFQQKQAVDYVRTATRNNVWYYRDRYPAEIA